MFKAKINNIVTTTELNRSLDLHGICHTLANVEYNPEKFNGAILKITEPSCTLLLFKSGKVVITGVKSNAEAVKASKRLEKELAKVGYKVKCADITCRNITASFDSGGKIHLDKIYYSNYKRCIYEPEEFPGLKFRNYNERIPLFIVFNSGKIILTGVKNLKNIDLDILEFYFEIIHPVQY